MSRIGLKKVKIPKGVKVSLEPGFVHVKGPKGAASKSVRPEVSVSLEGDELSVSRSADTPFVRSLHGLTRSEINNAIIGVTDGYAKTLDILGVGYRASLEGRTLVLNLGFSHLIRYDLPEGIDAVVEKQTTLTLKGTDKYLVGEVAAKVRSFRPPEPYKGKGVKYRNEKIIRKEGKKGK
ncbi:MAG: 50S ribosomal protein L6 [Nitrospirota bacterium]|nr:50S ribosomal protein L6 [Nitrospirota bacterium]